MTSQCCWHQSDDIPHYSGTKPKVDFVSLLKSSDVHEGKDAKFVAELSGDALRMEWYHNDKPVGIWRISF